MSARNHQLFIVEAVETLSNIADLEYDQEIGVVQKQEFNLLGERLHYKTVNWLQQQEGSSTISLVRETFRIIIYYIHEFYKVEYSSLTDQNTVEGIKAIMVLVEEAAKKLDHYTKLFSNPAEKRSSVTEFKEYKQLQEFYLLKIARKKDEGGLSRWILSLSLNKDKIRDENVVKNISSDPLPASFKDNKRVFVNLETVKIDSEYELLYIRKQDGSRFFNARLLRNVKLVCDLENYVGGHKKLDPLAPIEFWYDHIAYGTAKQIMKGLGSQLDYFLKELRQIKNNELIEALNKTVMALMFCSQNRNLLHHQPVKSCTGYFKDFLIFLRAVLETAMYKKLMLQPPNKNNHLAWDLIELPHKICALLYTNTLGWEEIPELIFNLLKEATRIATKNHLPLPQTDEIGEEIAYNYAAFTALMKQHPNGPLLKLIKSLENSSINVFDPLHQQNLPQQLFDFYYEDNRISLIRMPTPTYQQSIDKAFITEEFKSFIRFYATFTPCKKHLIINLQNRTSWREFARCRVLEELQFQSDYMKQLCVVTLPVDTDFYFQLDAYCQSNQAVDFMDQFKEHLKDAHSGFYFPREILTDELESFMDAAFKAIHHIFFSDQKNLSKEQRLNFIEISYLFLQLKLLEWTGAQTFSLMCKDGIDSGSMHVSLLFVFLKLINQHELQENEWKFLNLMVFMPALLLRERVVLAQPFNRMILALKQIETTIKELGSDVFAQLIEEKFKSLFKSTILHSTLLIPHLKTHLAQNFDKVG